MTRARSLLLAMKQDAKRAVHHLWFNTLAGSPFVPRPVRWLLYRIGGLHVDTVLMSPGITITGRGVTVGRSAFVNHGVTLDASRGSISIGRKTLVAPGVMILTATHELHDGQPGPPVYLQTTVGEQVWLGARCTVLPGVTIADGCIVAAGAVVAHDLTVPGVYAGIPAKWTRDLDAASASDPTQA